MLRGFAFGLSMVLFFAAPAIQAQTTSHGVQAVAQRAATASLSQTAVKPTLTIIVKNSAEVLADLKFLLSDLAKAPGQYSTVEGILSVFVTGIDTQQPAIIAGYLRKGAGDNSLKFTTSIPVADAKGFKDFRDALKDLDVKSKLAPGNPNAFQLTMNSQPAGYMVFDSQKKYAQIADELSTLQSGQPLPEKSLLGADDVVIVVDNTQQSQAERKQAFARIRKEGLAGLKARTGEHPSDFALRKQAAEQQFDEIERYFVEAEYIRIGLKTDAAARRTTAHIEMKALAGTSLAESIEMVSRVKDVYAAALPPNAIVSDFVNFPLDSLRKRNIQEFVKLARPRAREKINANNKFTDEQKKTNGDLSDLVFDVVEGVGGLDAVSGFFSMSQQAPRSYSILGSVRIADGQKFVAGLKQLAANEKDRVKLNVAKIDAYDLHALSVADKAAKFPELLGKETTVYIATGPTSIWYATGEQGLETVKKAVTAAATATPASTNTLLKIESRILPFIELLDSRRKQIPVVPLADPKAEKAEAKLRKAREELRKLALESFAGGKDTLHINLERREQAIHLDVQVDEGLLTFVGRSIAKFVKENLE